MEWSPLLVSDGWGSQQVRLCLLGTLTIIKNALRLLPHGWCGNVSHIGRPILGRPHRFLCGVGDILLRTKIAPLGGIGFYLNALHVCVVSLFSMASFAAGVFLMLISTSVCVPPKRPRVSIH